MPILSLRMLGRLDETLSCANSRFFRQVLYRNQTVANYLRENVILHWSSERAVPRVTIDYGDGRKLETTITGNSIHYLMDHSGKVIDAMPGLVTPDAFLYFLQYPNQELRALSPRRKCTALRDLMQLMRSSRTQQKCYGITDSK